MYDFKAVEYVHYIEFIIVEDGDDEVTKGYIKWDGCSNWDMSPDGVMLHFCFISDMKEFNQILESCYQYAKDYFDNEFFD